MHCGSMSMMKARRWGGTGQDRTGQDGTGQDRTGQDGTGRDRTGQDGTGQNNKVTETGFVKDTSMQL